MRQYQLIWEGLKLHHKASLLADPALHTRIIRAVRKEKNKDIAWKYLQSESNKKYRLLDDSIGNNLKFTLILTTEFNHLLYKI